MASRYETGHFINLSNFSKLINYLYNISNYVPDTADLRIPKLEILRDNTETATQNLLTNAAMLQQNINERQELYAQTRRLAMRLMRYLNANFPDHEATNDVKSHYKLLFALKLTKIPTVAEDGTVHEKTYSSNRLIFNSLADNFRKMYERIRIMSDYAPENSDFQIPNLQQKYQELINANAPLDSQYQKVYKARNARDLLMYQEVKGLVYVAARVRKYVQHQYGIRSVAAQYVRSIRFTHRKLNIKSKASISNA